MNFKSPGFYASIIVAVVAAVSVFALVTSYNSTRNGIIQRESALTAQYLDNQNELSSYVLTVKEAMGVANVATEAVDKIITDAIQGRYEDKGNSGVGEAQFVVNAVHEAYPDINGVNVNYQNVQNAIIGGREAFKNQQTKLLDMIREYDTYRQTGLIHSTLVSWVGAPTDRLKAKVGDKELTGKEALEKMRTIVQSKDSLEAFETGVDKGVAIQGLSGGDDKDQPASGQ